MKESGINIFVTFDKKMIQPFETMLYSLIRNNEDEHFHVYLIQSGLTEYELQTLRSYCKIFQVEFTAILMDKSYFAQAKIMPQYPQEMYYRLLAPLFLPQDLDRIIYVDPDILVLNSIRPLWNLDLEGNLFAAASHSGGFDFVNDINRIRLDTTQDYYNTGVILMDLEKARMEVIPEDIFKYVTDHSQELMLPDQDVFNALYGDRTLPLDDRIWNYDSRHYMNYMVKDVGHADMDWVMEHTVMLHFCGKNKPWKKNYSGRFSALYKHYQRQALLHDAEFEKVFSYEG